MGKASSSKKVARAARAGGRTSSGPKRNLGYPLAIAAIIVVGVLLVLFARSENQDAAAATPVANVDHWHAAMGIYVCDAFLPALTDQVSDTTGLHTHGDGIAHVHPYSTASSGKNATLEKWGETTGLDFTSNGITVNGTTYEDGYDCNGEPAKVTASVWDADDTSADPKVYTSDLGSIRFDRDRMAITIAVVPEGTEVPLPPSLGDLDRLDPATDNVISDDSTTTTAPTASTDTTGVGSTDTTAAGAP
jgi:hypothetical protein